MITIFCIIQNIILQYKFKYLWFYGGCMALDPRDIAELLKLRALGFSQAEIAEKLKTSQQVIAYQLRKLKEQANKKGTDEVFNAALIGGLAGAAAGIGIVALLELLKNNKEWIGYV